MHELRGTWGMGITDDKDKLSVVMRFITVYTYKAMKTQCEACIND